MAIVGLVLVLTVLTAFAIVSDLQTSAAASAAARSTRLNDAYWQARYAVGAEESLERKYRLEPSQAARIRYGEAAAAFASAMHRVAVRGAPSDRALATKLLGQQQSYRDAVRRMFAAVDMGDETRVLRIDGHEVDPRFGSIEAQVIAAARAHRIDALASVRSLEATQSASLVGIPIAFACGLMLVALFSVILVRQRRRVEAALSAELVAQREASTALSDSNHRLLALNKAKDEFVATVSHELRTPLTSIYGYAELLADDPQASAETARCVEVISRNTQRLQSLVADLLLIAEVNAGEFALKLGPVDLAAIIRDAIEAAGPTARAKGLTLINATAPSTALRGDTERLGQLLDNLLSNALKFTPTGGSIEVRTYATPGTVIVEVSDSGIGISEADQAHLFERFYRTEQASRGAIQGTGLGLAISQTIVAAHKGTIAVASARGLGTTFRIELPTADAQQRQPVDRTRRPGALAVD